MTRRVRLTRDARLYAVICADTGLWLAGLLSEENRALYLSWWPGWEVVE
jgi:hypothetical protein